MMRREEVIYSCPFQGCQYSCNSHDRLSNHVKLHEGGRPFACSFEGCDKAYTTSSHLKRHQAIHELPGLRCTVKGCSMVLKTRACLQKHLDCVHHKKHKKYKCSLCDDEFNKHNWLRTHTAKVHTKTLPLLCPVEKCGRRFLYPSRLKRHMKLHDGYTCTKPDCGKKFFQWTLYVKHFKHFHPTIHKCNFCNKEFLRSALRDEHEQVHKETRPIYMCEMPDCSKYYFHKKNLSAHMKSYHGEHPFLCPESKCLKSFKTKEELEKHSSVHDPNKPLRKKKKKKKLSFAAKLAGLGPPIVTKKQKEESTSKDEMPYDAPAFDETDNTAMWCEKNSGTFEKNNNSIVCKKTDNTDAMHFLETILANCGSC